LAGYQVKLEELRAQEVSVLALSTDPQEKAKEGVEADACSFRWPGG